MLKANEALWQKHEKKPLPKVLKQLKISLIKEIISSRIETE